MATEDATRGRQASKPWHIPPKGWFDVLMRVKGEMGKDHISLIAAGCAFYGLLAVFPGIAAAISLWGLLADPNQIVSQIDGFTNTMPPEAADLIHEQAVSAASADTGALLTALIGIAIGVFSASKGIKSLTEGLNVAYDEDDERSFIKKTLLNVALTFGAVIGLIVAAVLVIAVPATFEVLGLGGIGKVLATIAQWIVLLGGALFAFGVLYRLAPDRDDARWEWLTGGAVFAVVLWIFGSWAFSIYVGNFASYNATYGTLGGVVILLMWLYLTAFVVLLGAEVNAELERQTKRDTTTGTHEPIGERGAYAADTVGAPAH
ncbi:YihY/virulence factor BrkB family protein [Parvularcula dongshanensis]|uniref:Membrane protein n=1 Tax=Parvularcula dongshanensis TaxID=1173995 RepID=A0A840I555_9PROT|nr:YihY/virulence factor BrkB family protein [Parvularcula dongshanensis]MBB4659413.1 membrane protein [Parvularcula dongshanensis]